MCLSPHIRHFTTTRTFPHVRAAGCYTRTHPPFGCPPHSTTALFVPHHAFSFTFTPPRLPYYYYTAAVKLRARRVAVATVLRRPQLNPGLHSTAPPPPLRSSTPVTPTRTAITRGASLGPCGRDVDLPVDYTCARATRLRFIGWYYLPGRRSPRCLPAYYTAPYHLPLPIRWRWAFYTSPAHSPPPTRWCRTRCYVGVILLARRPGVPERCHRARCPIC